MDFTALREEYCGRTLDITTVDPDPIRQFRIWMQHAVQAGLDEPNAMTLATATLDGVPSARIVLLKGVEDDAFLFFTNYRSRKAHELAANPHAALVFYWKELNRQVRINGEVSKTSSESSAGYFRTRPYRARLGAVASQQSEVLTSREDLERRIAELDAQYQGKEVPLPDHWGGYRVRPVSMEFWQGRPNRIHDRIRYNRLENNTWSMCRLSP